MSINKKRKRDVFMGNLDNRPFGWMSFKAKQANISTWAKELIDCMIRTNAIYKKEEGVNGVNIVWDTIRNKYYYILEKCAVYKSAKEKYLYEDSSPEKCPIKDLYIITHPDENEHVFLVCSLSKQQDLCDIFNDNNRQIDRGKRRNYWIFSITKEKSDDSKDDYYLKLKNYHLKCLKISDEAFYTAIKNGEDIYPEETGK